MEELVSGLLNPEFCLKTAGYTRYLRGIFSVGGPESQGQPKRCLRARREVTIRRRALHGPPGLHVWLVR